ncbi:MULTISPECIES: cytochrome P450 [unclassified Bradyrhizobium]|uniref:cytochrome P450 n=1 Tax=unclassified Bradyrhizobium TaxID=2631580 RepID=UPI0020B225AB|nr:MULTISPECIES: cytochrome P450 [unclassified Bradyrhizobium]MCP3397064.1 cytochrome P450 [Bradyrhizobium sp. CCGB20]MCP3405576.1 cytochrome P450 [Bradyrhizobium sp. CCGB01]
MARLKLRCAFPALFVRLEDLAPTIAAEDVVYMPSYVILAAAPAGHLPLRE